MKVEDEEANLEHTGGQLLWVKAIFFSEMGNAEERGVEELSFGHMFWEFELQSQNMSIGERG